MRNFQLTDLSPAAQAVAWAYDNAPERPTGNHRYHWIAAALRAVADQVVPPLQIAPQKNLESRREAMEWGMRQQTQITRNQLLAIAYELEGQP